MLSDAELIKTFVQLLVEGRDPLLANSNLRTDSAFGIMQLFSKQDGILLRATLKEKPPHFQANSRLPYYNLINAALVEQNYIITDDTDDMFLRYEFFKVPKGYHLNCTNARNLWVAWWKYSRRIQNQVIPMELVVRQRNRWYPIKQLTVSDGVLYVRTLGQEFPLHLEDLVFWLNKVTTAPVAAIA